MHIYRNAVAFEHVNYENLKNRIGKIIERYAELISCLRDKGT